MHLAALLVGLLACAGIIVLGIRFLLQPRQATLDFGVADDNLRALTEIKGARDITSGVVLLVVLTSSGRATLVHVRTEHDHQLSPLLSRLKWTAGGHGLLGARPRSFQVTPDIPDRRRATQQKEVRPAGPTASKRVSSPPVGTFSSAPDITDAGITTASLTAAAVRTLGLCSYSGAITRRGRPRPEARAGGRVARRRCPPVAGARRA